MLTEIRSSKFEIRKKPKARNPNNQPARAEFFRFGLRHSDFGFGATAHGYCHAACKIVFQKHGPDVPFRLSALPIPGARRRRYRHRRQLRRANHRLSRLPPAFRRVHPSPAARGQSGTSSRHRRSQIQAQLVAHRGQHSAILAGGQSVECFCTQPAFFGSAQTTALGGGETGLPHRRFSPD